MTLLVAWFFIWPLHRYRPGCGVVSYCINKVERVEHTGISLKCALTGLFSGTALWVSMLMLSLNEQPDQDIQLDLLDCGCGYGCGLDAAGRMRMSMQISLITTSIKSKNIMFR